MANLTGSRSNFPNSVDLIPAKYDLSPVDVVKAARWQQLKLKDRVGPEIQEFIDLTEDLKDFLFGAEDYNKAFDIVIATQQHYRDNVVGYIQIKQDEFQDNIDRFNNKGTYSASIRYYQNNFVIYNAGDGEQTFICIDDNNGDGILGIPPSNLTKWRRLTIKGETGPRGVDGLGLKFKGAFNPTTSYQKDDGVQYGGMLFGSLLSGNLNNTPNLTQDTIYWAKVLDVAVSTKKLVGTRNIPSTINNVNFMTGEIIAFNPSVDSLEVYFNSIRLTKNIDYTINVNNQSIDKVEGLWVGDNEQPAFFEFVVFKNILNNLVFSDGSSIENGTIAKSKLTVDLVNDLNNIPVVGISKPTNGTSLWFEVTEEPS